jgi:hypothetical protein
VEQQAPNSAKNLPLPPTLAVDDDVKQRDEKDGDISNTRNNNKCELLPSAMVMGPGGGVTTEMCNQRTIMWTTDNLFLHNPSSALSPKTDTAKEVG